MQAQEYWDNYWQQGFITSFANEIDGTYGGKIAQFWQGFFQSVAPQAKVLDLCSGNGALPLLFLKTSPLLDIIATDLANLDEARLIKSTASQFPTANIRFMGRVDCTDLPFESDQFDVITSQFGFEYAESKLVLTQAFEKLKPSGYFTSVMHVHDSRFISQNSQSLDFLNDLLTSEFLMNVEGYVSYREQQTEQQVYWHNLNQIAKQLKAQNEVEYVQLNIDGFLSALTLNTPRGRGKELSKLFNEDMTNYRQRLTELVKAAQTEEDLLALIAESRQLGFNVVTSQRLIDSTGILGHCFVFKK